MLHSGGMVGIPCGEQGRWTEFTRSLMVLERPQGTQLAFVYGAYIQANRDELVRQMLASNAQWLFMVDDDHTFDRRLLINLLDRQVPVVGALAVARKPPYFICAFSETDRRSGRSVGMPMHGFRFEMQEVAAVGTGAILVRRAVFEALDPPWFASSYDEEGNNVSEDVSFCERAREAGFGVWLDGTQQLGHLTGVTLSIDPRGIVFDLGSDESIVIPMEQIEEALPVEEPAPPAADEVPIVVGPSGLTGRVPQPRPQDEPILPVGEDENGGPVYAQPPGAGPAIPAGCLRRLTLPGGTHNCDAYCAGRQRDGGCLADVVRAAQAAGLEWRFELDPDGFWTYAGDPIPA
jgi:hypothetical protein